MEPRPRDAAATDGVGGYTALLLRRPRLHRGQSGERHATWLELFFDLVFVVAVAQLARLLEHDLSALGLLEFTLLFVPVWWQWLNFSYYLDQYEIDDAVHRAALFTAMFGVIALALAIPDAVHGGARQFTLALVVLRALILALYLHAWRAVPEGRELTARYSLTYSMTLALWLLSLAVPAPGRYWLWGTAQLAEIANGPVTHAAIRQVPQRVSHMDERLGLFVIIVLGEAVVQVATSLADIEWRWQGTLTGVCGFLCAVWAWWIYFVRADPSILTRALRGDRRTLLLAFAYAYSHFFVFAGITAAAVGIREAVRTGLTEALPAGTALALGCGAAAFLLGVTALQWAAPHSLPRAVVRARLAAAALAALLAAGGPVLGAMGSVVALAATLALLVTVETVYGVRYDVRHHAALRAADLQPERE